MEAYWGPAISKNPYMSFKYKGSKGDMLMISWIDNKGDSDSDTVKVK
jgi:sulfur-oxidizing protein SoxZ